MHLHAQVAKGTLGFTGALASLTVSTLETAKLGLQVISAALSVAIAALTLLALIRGRKSHPPDNRSSDKERP